MSARIAAVGSGTRRGRVGLTRQEVGLALGLVLAWCTWCDARQAPAQPPPSESPPAEATPPTSDQPITTLPGELGDLLRGWWEEGTAAGHVGDRYDNRDGGHSMFNHAPYPQIQRVTYTPADIEARRHWAAQRSTLPYVVFGNSSTSAPPQQGGSNSRLYYSGERGLALLYEQYTHNNLYIYPEHRDHDPGHNGVGGYGDLYPTNTPYLITSQGSSGSDRPFLQAVAATLAALRPDVKKRLVETGLLMPTVQMIFRISAKNIDDPREYLTGEAHPSVFDGRQVDGLEMARLAHDITTSNLPPMVQLKVVEEDEPVAGRDFFETSRGEKLADTPDVIARVFRGSGFKRRMVVSAQDSYDLNGRPLEYHWVVLRGDAQRIEIRPRGDAAAEAEIVVPYHPRSPVEDGSPLESNRVDIGVFVHNGAWYSAPAFVTFHFLDHESRIYDDQGRIVELGYGVGEPGIEVRDWNRLFEYARSDTWSAKLLGFEREEVPLVARIATDYKTARAAVDKARAHRTAVTYARAEALRNYRAAEQALREATQADSRQPTEESKALLDKAIAVFTAARAARDQAIAESAKALRAEQAAAGVLNNLLSKKTSVAHPALQPRVRAVFEAALVDHEFLTTHRGELQKLLATAERRVADRLATHTGGLVKWGYAEPVEDAGPLDLKLKAPGADPDGQLTPSPLVRSMIGRLNAQVLATLVYPGAISATYRMNYVDPRIAAPKLWRDVYHYRGDVCTGWTRYASTGKTEYNRDGHQIIQRDPLGRCLKARTVRYVQAPATRPGLNTNPLQPTQGEQVVHYAYDGDDDFQGRIVRRETVSIQSGSGVVIFK